MSSKYFHFDAKYKIFKKLPCSCNYAVTILCLYENKFFLATECKCAFLQANTCNKNRRTELLTLHKA